MTIIFFQDHTRLIMATEVTVTATDTVDMVLDMVDMVDIMDITESKYS